MKPRTKLEKRVMTLSCTLPPLSEAQRALAEKNVNSGVAYRAKKNTLWCTCCGGEFDSSLNVCPHCNAKLAVEMRIKRVERLKMYFTIITTCKEFQVVRQYMLEREICKGSAPMIVINEVVQNWINDKGKETIVARPTTMCYNWYDIWDYTKPMSLKQLSSYGHMYYPNKYEDRGSVYPIKRVLPIVKQRGYHCQDIDMPMNVLFKMILSDNEAECLLKTKQLPLLYYKFRRGIKELSEVRKCCIKIATRHNYIVQDASMWLDYIDTLNYLGLDIHNPMYVCPENLEQAHDRFLKRRKRVEARIEAKRKREEARMWEEEYHNTKSKFFGLCFGNDKIVITAIKSVDEMREEGDVMHHCVFVNGYYKNANSLILSAKDKQGNRIETIEIDLKTFKVVQSRGLCNQNTPQHDEILKLVKNNMNKIKAVA